MSNQKAEFTKILANEVPDQEQVDQLADYIISAIEADDFDRDTFIADCEDPGEDGDDAWSAELMECVNQCLDLALNPPKAKVSPKKLNLKGLKAKSKQSDDNSDEDVEDKVEQNKSDEKKSNDEKKKSNDEEKKSNDEEKKSNDEEKKSNDEKKKSNDEEKKSNDDKPSLKIHVKSEPTETKKVSPSKRATREKIHNAYHMFGFAHRTALQEKHDKKTQNQLIEQTLSKLWKMCKEDPTSEEYIKEIKALGQEPHDEAYFKKLAEEHNEKAITFNESHGFETKGRSPKKDDGPKGPLNNYVVFFTEKRPEVAEANPDLKAKEIMSKVSDLWNAMTDDEKKVYDDKAREINEKEGRVTKSKKKTEKDTPLKKTDCYKIWQPIWKEAFKVDNPDASSDLIRSKMSEAWKSVKKDKAEYKKYVKLAEDENINRGLVTPSE
jgi:hypothetical protein